MTVPAKDTMAAALDIAEEEAHDDYWAALEAESGAAIDDANAALFEAYYRESDELEVGEPVALTDESTALIYQALSRYGASFGSGSLNRLTGLFVDALRWAQAHHDPACGTFENFAWHLFAKHVREHRDRYGHDKLRSERRDGILRSEAEAGGAAAMKYLTHAKRLFERARRAYPRRWFVPGMTVEELYLHLEGLLLERLCSDDPCWEPYELPGLEATYVFFDRKTSPWHLVNADGPAC